jgi:HK97 family phage prohead protease
MPIRQTRELMPEQVREMHIVPESVREDGTFDAVLATQIPVIRYDPHREQRYSEILLCNASAIDSSRLDKSIPLLNQHGRWGSINGILGRIEGWSVENEELVITGRMDMGDPVAVEVHRKMRQGFIKDMSAGYQIKEAQRVRTEDGTVELRATKWMPTEGSFVIIPADHNANIRSNDEGQASKSPDRVHPCTITTRSSEEEMPNKKTPQGNPAPAPEPEVQGDRTDPTPVPDPVPQPTPASAAPVAPATRAADPVYVLDRCAAHGIETSVAREMIATGLTREQVNDGILDRLAESQPEPVRTASQPNAAEESMRGRVGIATALEYRLQPNSVEIDDRSRHLIGLPLSEMARMSLGREGAGLYGPQIFDRALHGSSDFALALADVANKTLRAEYELQDQTWKVIATQATVPDFKNIRRLQTGQHPDLELVNEHGEFKAGTFTESQETYRIYTYGKIIGLSRQALINDDLESLPRVIRGSAAAVARLRGDTVWGLLTANGNMADGVALFHANHANLGTTGAISETTLSEARKLMRLQTGLDGKRIKVKGKTIIVPPSLETTAEKLLTAILANATGDVNVFSNKLELAVEERLEDNSTTAWYVVGDPNRVDFIEAATLRGNNGPEMQTRVGFEVDGIEWRVRDDFGAGVLDHRGALKNAGA